MCIASSCGNSAVRIIIIDSYARQIAQVKVEGDFIFIRLKMCALISATKCARTKNLRNLNCSEESTQTHTHTCTKNKNCTEGSEHKFCWEIVFRGIIGSFKKLCPLQNAYELEYRHCDGTSHVCDNFIYWQFKLRAIFHGMHFVPKRKLQTERCSNRSRAHVCRAVNGANFNLDTWTLEWESMTAASKSKRLYGVSTWAFVYKQLRKLKIGHQTHIYSIYAAHLI